MAAPTGALRALRVLIADDHALIRRSFRQDLETAGIEVCAEAANATDAVRAALAAQPDLCLLDMHMPEGGGISAARSIRRAAPAIKIVMVTALPDGNGALAAARAGADGYLGKEVGRRRLPQVVRAVADDDTTYPRRLLYPLLWALQGAERSEN